jgi:release factor glutamine methyltransferase
MNIKSNKIPFLSISRALDSTIEKFRKAKITSGTLDAEVLLSYVLKKDRVFLLTHPEYILTTIQKNYFLKLVTRREKHEPVSYLVGHREFYGLDFKTRKGVLIPRPETELLVDTALEFIKGKYNKQEKIIVADIGTGSGAIIISLAKNIAGKNYEFVGVDLSNQAIKLSKENAKLHKVRIKFLGGNLLLPIKGKNPEIILANLPYVKKNLKKKSDIEKAIEYEPAMALYGGKDGLKMFANFFKQLKKLKLEPDLIGLEIGDNQGPSVSRLAKEYLPQYKIKIKKDLAEKNRIVIIEK